MTYSQEESRDDACFVSPPIVTQVTDFCQQLTNHLSPTALPQVSPAALAYLGDTVYELYIRTAYLLPPKRLHQYHQAVVSQVRAEAQALHLQALQPYLTPPELDILRRGRNAASGGPRRLDPELYQQATSLETLLGYLYLHDPQRLLALLQHLPLADATADLSGKMT
ncbi:Mini-ribonuclease 3 [Neosynechococcus sphagnicola]|uniref:Mini-ribonuclease 3 n=1 Tax=Neosynechococcus sphagnicola TaxID=1501145 RepID=UPI00068D8E3D|nr:ribonuclease III domain-containing protein [Neosynechococcus sphagnicola]